MNNPNAPLNRYKAYLKARWYGEDHPGAESRFQLMLFAKDVGIFVLIPLMAVFIFKSCENAMSRPRRILPTQSLRDGNRFDSSKSQIIDFRMGSENSMTAGIAKRAPGTLVRLRLLNVVETYSNAPVHAQIVDVGLGRLLMGGTLIGDATPDNNFDRITITFHYAKDGNRENVAVPISARALGLDGTLGLIAEKKEGMFARSAIGSAGSATQDIQGKTGDSADLKQFLFKALTSGLMQEFGAATQVEKNRAQVLSLSPNTEFFAELTDFFPGAGK